MWRTFTAHERKPTEFLDDALTRVEFDRSLRARADATLVAEAASEPLVAEAMRTPQTPPHHAEGPFLDDHLRLALQTLYAVFDGALRLVGIEEFARLKGFGGEVEEIEETIKENAALYETFVLCHDVAKWPLVYFDAPEGSRGRSEGFVEAPRAHRDDAGSAERAKARSAFLKLYDAFVAQRKGLSRTEAQTEFYLTYGIEAHYAGHGRAFHAPAYRALLERVASRRSLPPRDIDLLETLIAHHLDPLDDFASPNPSVVLRYHAIAAKHGYDADDFIVLLQGCLFLDTVCGSRRQTVGAAQHDADSLGKFLRSEHDFAPWRRAEKERYREELRKRERNAGFRAVGLDGVALMNLLGMDPGPAFGETLRHIHEAVVAGAPVPRVGKKIDAELDKRIAGYFGQTFQKGD